MQTFGVLWDQAQQSHGHRCPGYVLGIRMALAGCRALGMEDPRQERSLIVFVETDRCAADALQSVTGCSLGKRTLKFMDYGKLAATFLHLGTGKAVRVTVYPDARQRAEAYRTDGLDRHAVQIIAYQQLADEDLLVVEHVQVTLAREDAPGPPVARTYCQRCGEEVSDRREVQTPAGDLCCACALGAYYQRLDEPR